MRITGNLFFSLAIVLISGCCKHKTDTVCNSTPIQVQPFIEKSGIFFCGGNDYEYTYTARKKAGIDSLTACNFSPPVAFPVDETDMAYIMLGRMSYHYMDTLVAANITKDTCLKKLTYEVNMIQKDTALWSNGGGILNIFCEVENIPADYTIDIKYKYVLMP